MGQAINFDEYYKENKSRLFHQRVQSLNALPAGERRVRNRPRDPEKQELLIQLDLKRWKRMIATGELEELAPRRWRWNTITTLSSQPVKPV